MVAWETGKGHRGPGNSHGILALATQSVLMNKSLRTSNFSLWCKACSLAILPILEYYRAALSVVPCYLPLQRFSSIPARFMPCRNTAEMDKDDSARCNKENYRPIPERTVNSSQIQLQTELWTIPSGQERKERALRSTPHVSVTYSCLFTSVLGTEEHTYPFLCFILRQELTKLFRLTFSSLCRP